MILPFLHIIIWVRFFPARCVNDFKITLQLLNRELYSSSGVQTSHFLEEGSLKLEGGHPPVLLVGRLLFKSYGRAGFLMYFYSIT